MLLLSTEAVWAGNDKRRGTAGATELLINPWARSNGWGSANVANVRGLDAFYSNIAGLSYVSNVEFSYTNTMLNGGKSGLNSGATINAFGLGVRLFDRGVMGLSIMSMGFGDIPVTTYDSPEPINGTFSPTLMNINVAYAHTFTASIKGGVNVKVVSESTDNISGSAFAVDAGIQYVTGENDELKFGISLKNWGPSFSFGGSGMSFTFINDADNTMTGECQYGMLNILNLRCGYVYQTDIFDPEKRTTSNSGLCAGASVDIPLSKAESENKTSLSIDYSFRASNNLRGTHAIGATFRF